MKLKSFSILLISLMAMPLAAGSIAVSKPEDVGLSSERLQRITQMIQRRIDAGELAGGVTLVARRGRIAHFEAQGVADLETKRPMAKESIFRIASMTKPVTGVAIMMLVEEGQVRLTDPVSRYIAEFRGIKVAVPLPARGPAAPAATTPQFYTVPAEREITIRDLLIHTSGLATGPMGNSELAKFSRKPNESLAEYIPRLGATPLEFQPGSRWQYSAFGAFDTLARIVEIASGRTFDQFLRERIFDPLEMKDIFFYPADDKRLATVYQLRDGKLNKSEWPNRTRSRVYYSGGGGLMCTAGDYLHFGQMLVNGGQLNGKRLLSPRTVDSMASPHVPDTLPGRPKGEGFGLSMRVVNNHVERVSLLSNGSYGWGGAHGTYFWVDPKEKIVAILMVQTRNREVTRDFEQAVMQAIVD